MSNKVTNIAKSAQKRQDHEATERLMALDSLWLQSLMLLCQSFELDNIEPMEDAKARAELVSLYVDLLEKHVSLRLTQEATVFLADVQMTAGVTVAEIFGIETLEKVKQEARACIVAKRSAKALVAQASGMEPTKLWIPGSLRSMKTNDEIKAAEALCE